MNIKLDNNTSVLSDANQYTLRQSRLSQDKEGNSTEVFDVIGYYATLNSALKDYVNTCIRESDSTSVKELIALHNKLEKKIEKLVKF